LPLPDAATEHDFFFFSLIFHFDIAAPPFFALPFSSEYARRLR